MKKVIYFPVFLWLLMPVISNAQILDPAFTELYNRYEFNKLFEEPEQNYAGCPYLDTAFVTGNLYMPNGVVYQNIPLRYNIYNDVFEFQQEGHTRALDTAMNYSMLSIGDRPFIFGSYYHGDSFKRGHMEVLYRGEYTLLKKYKVIFTPPTKPEAYKDPKPATFTNSRPEYFVSKEGQTIFFNNEKSLAQACGYDYNTLKAFTKENKINFRKEESLIELFNHLNNKQE